MKLKHTTCHRNKYALMNKTKSINKVKMGFLIIKYTITVILFLIKYIILNF